MVASKPRELEPLLLNLAEDFYAFDRGMKRARIVAEYRDAMLKARTARLLLEKIFPDDN